MWRANQRVVFNGSRSIQTFLNVSLYKGLKGGHTESMKISYTQFCFLSKEQSAQHYKQGVSLTVLGYVSQLSGS